MHTSLKEAVKKTTIYLFASDMSINTYNIKRNEAVYDDLANRPHF